MFCPIRSAALDSPNDGAIRDGERWNSWEDVDAMVAQTAACLAERGVSAGGAVAVVGCAPMNTLRILFACARLGARVYPLNHRLRDRELQQLLFMAQPQVCVGGDGLRSALLPATQFCGELAVCAPLSRLPAVTPSALLLDEERPWVHLATSGTTGAPKLVPLTLRQFDEHAKAAFAVLGASARQTWLLNLPLFHVGGVALLHRVAVLRARAIISSSFDAANCLKELQTEEVTHVSLVGTMVRRILDEARGQVHAPHLEVVLVGGGPIAPSLLQRARTAGLPVLQTYGLTEACSQVCTERIGEADGTTCGPPLPGVDMRVVAADGAELGPGVVGLIEVRGPAVCSPRGAWLATGDYGAVDVRGRLTVYARRTDLVVVGGENVFPGEVERVLESHPNVLQAVVVPRADEEWGQVPVAWVQLAAPTAAQELLQWCAHRLASIKVPRSMTFVADFPRNAMGKVQRDLIRESAANIEAAPPVAPRVINDRG